MRQQSPLSANRFAAVVGLILLLAAPELRADQSPAYAALMHGRVEEATNLLRREVQVNAGDGAAHLLLCRANFAQELVDDALDECQKAAADQPNDSNTQMWLGRALGLKAEHANPLAAYSLAKQVRAAFERAVQLDAANVNAASDLGQFYVDAPSFVGGGEDRLNKLVGTMQARFPAKAHRLLARMAEKNGDLGRAEAEFKLAVAAGQRPEAYSDLALFYQVHDRADDAQAAAGLALAAEHGAGPVDFDIATILISAKRATDVAEHAMRAYLASANQSDDAPVFKVHLELGKLLAKRGDRAGAKAEYAQAAALAPRYEPARKAAAGGA